VSQVLVVTELSEAAEAIRSAYPDANVRVSADPGPGGAGSDRGQVEIAFFDVAAMRRLSGDADDPAVALRAFRAAWPGARLVVMSPQAEIRSAIAYVREGASDYLTCPVVREEVQLVRDDIRRRERLSSELNYLRDSAAGTEVLGSIASRAPAMTAVLNKIRQVAPTRSTVLLTGETGTGKSFLARAIHQHSTRAERQFVSVHCGAIPDTLLESELFGHERGAFTGADRRKLGKFEIADGGTLFLDEVATITPATQVKLLNVLQERSIQRVGGEREIAVDVRILAATNVDLDRMTSAGGFRSDLYYRLNVFPIEIPPLRHRRQDIPLLVDLFLDRLRRIYVKEIDGVESSVLEGLERYGWPGNVRELENLLERAFILETSPRLTPSCFPDELFADQQSATGLPVDPSESIADARARAVAVAEREYLQRQLALHDGRIGAVADAAGITPRQLHTLMTRHGLRKEDYKARG
jgi:DNA-binding NtrC family response regulator